MTNNTLLFASALLTALVMVAIFAVGAITKTNFFLVLLAASGFGFLMAMVTNKMLTRRNQ